ncbi:GNAT family N-acetyltransferase [Luteibaculum oceani]|uniref:GNAT family N-acetyltransferase n=1 Tax=Luteibaculum oceani TaxID=1294296 RepID=A0A5C6VAW9_9FLAO|nr:GNAT family N-acetyltransferase [Luteibaculum oceani]TXC81526.1 GNAT family N-acetyltransferase [Luteibaculum oceani]
MVESFYNSKSFFDVLSKTYSAKIIILDDKAENLYGLKKGKKIIDYPFGFFPQHKDYYHGTDIEAKSKQLVDFCIDNKVKSLEIKTSKPIEETTCKSLNLIETQGSLTAILKLGNYDDIRSSFSKSLRQNIRTTERRAKESDVAYSVEKKAGKSLYEWYNLMLRLYRDKHLMIPQPLSLFKNLINQENKEWGTMLLTAKIDERIIGGIFLIYDSQHWEYGWAATDQNFKKLGINTLLVNEAIKMACTENANSFGFGLTPQSDKKLAKFKSRWGCEMSPTYIYNWKKSPKPMDLNKNYLFIRKFIPLIPIPVLRVISEKLVPKLL